MGAVQQNQAGVVDHQEPLGQVPGVIGHFEIGPDPGQVLLCQRQRGRVPSPDRLVERAVGQMHGVQVGLELDRAPEHLPVVPEWPDATVLHGDLEGDEVVAEHQAEGIHGHPPGGERVVQVTDAARFRETTAPARLPRCEDDGLAECVMSQIPVPAGDLSGRSVLSGCQRSSAQGGCGEMFPWSVTCGR